MKPIERLILRLNGGGLTFGLREAAIVSVAAIVIASAIAIRYSG